MNIDIPQAIQDVNNGIHHLLSHFHDDEYNPKPIPLERLKNWTREGYQALYRDQIKEIIRKLKTKQELTSEDMKIMEQWMIGDLRMYTKMEDHEQEWKTDLQQLTQKIESYKDESVHRDGKKLLELQGLLLELDHVLADFEKYQYSVERIKRYKTYIGKHAETLTDTQRYELADILKDMLYSSLY